jgi:hypothetical protein
MTQAQYQRAVASQNQSKVADQWAFFQAKRIRGTTYEATADLLLAQKADLFTADTAIDAAQDLVHEIEASETVATKAGAGKLRDQLKSLHKRAGEALAEVTTAFHPPATGWQGLAPDKVKTALDALQSYPKLEPNTESDGIDADQRQKLDEILKDIRDFKPEKDIAPKTLAIQPETLDKAMEQAKRNAALVTDRGKNIERVLEKFDVLINGQTALAREFGRTVESAITAAMREKNVEFKALLELRERVNTVRDLSARLQGDYKAARHAFTARRYEDDARSNQDAAFLYDVEVLRSGALSDRHLKRSFGFMIAMLIAQVGVTIGSVAIALKWKIPVWMIAAFSGFAAVMLGMYVFLELGPYLW